MVLRKFDPDELRDEYGVRSRRLFPWPDVVTPPFGSMWSVLAPGQSTTRHNHHEAESFFVVRGSGTITVGDETLAVAPGDVVYAPPFDDHTIANTGTEELEVVAVYWEDLAALGRPGAADDAAARRTLVTATPPTVNGALHLGHMSGPYLAADAFVRYLRARGREAFYLTGADEHQSYVETKARELGTSRRETARRFTGEVEQCLAACAIQPQVFARPHRSPYHRELTQSFFRRLVESGHVEPREAPAPYCRSCDRFLFEAHVTGRCPHCGEGADGCACEACGRPNDCIDLADARCKRCATPVGARPLRRFYFPLSRWTAELREFHSRVAMGPHLRALCDAMLDDGLPDIAVSHPTDWGIPVPVDGFPGQSLYVWLEMAPGFLAATQELTDGLDGVGGWEELWKSPDCDVVQFFGFDNGYFHALLFPALWLAYDADIRLPTAFVTNEFYLLDGEKFSTSRGHAVWAHEFAAGESVDTLRLHLALDRPETRQTSFTHDAYRRTAREVVRDGWAAWLAEVGERVCTEFDGRAPVTGGYSRGQRHFLERVQAAIDEVERAFDPGDFSTARAARAACALAAEAREFGRAEAWRSGRSSSHDARRTAVALELLAAATFARCVAPLVPELAAGLGQALGCGDLHDTRWSSTVRFLPGGQDVRGLVTFAQRLHARHADA